MLGTLAWQGDEYQVEPGVLSHLHIPTHLPSVAGWYHSTSGPHHCGCPPQGLPSSLKGAQEAPPDF